MMPAKIIDEWLGTCAGCEMTLLDIGDAILEILPKVEFVHSPVVMDHKYYGQTGEGTKMELPEADIGLVSGCVRTEENKEVLQEVRAKCKVLIANGACASWGGVPSLANSFTREDLLNTVYKSMRSTVPSVIPSEKIPALLDRVYAVDEVVKVDVYLPGCPTEPGVMVQALNSLLENKPFVMEEKAVCEDCPLKREKKAVAPGTVLKRTLELPAPDKERCLLELGYFCIGPATRTGCHGGGWGGPKIPRCIAAGMPCEGCFGPIRAGASQMVDMMGALSTIGVDVKAMLDRPASFSRFVGAKARLRPR